MRDYLKWVGSVGGAIAIVGCGGGSGGGSNVTLNTNLIHWWKFNGNANDSAGTLNATPTGTVSYEISPTGQGIVLDGSTNGVCFNPTADMQFAKSFTISMWAKLASYPTGGKNMTCLVFEGDDRSGNDPYTVAVGPDQKMHFLITGVSEAFASGTPADFPVNQWELVTAVYDQPKGVQSIYINGALAVSNPDLHDLTPPVALDSGSNPGFSIGNNNFFFQSPFNYGWNGAISDVRVYTRALSVSEIVQLYGHGVISV